MSEPELGRKNGIPTNIHHYRVRKTVVEAAPSPRENEKWIARACSRYVGRLAGPIRYSYKFQTASREFGTHFNHRLCVPITCVSDFIQRLLCRTERTRPPPQPPETVPRSPGRSGRSHVLLRKPGERLIRESQMSSGLRHSFPEEVSDALDPAIWTIHSVPDRALLTGDPLAVLDGAAPDLAASVAILGQYVAEGD